MCYFGLICSPICERGAASKAATRDKISSGAGAGGGWMGMGRGFLINLDMLMSMRVGADVSDKMYWSAITQRRIKAANFTFSLISFDEPNYFQRHVYVVDDVVLPNWIFLPTSFALGIPWADIQPFGWGVFVVVTCP